MSIFDKEWFKANSNDLEGKNKSYSIEIKGNNAGNNYKMNRVVLEICKRIFNDTSGNYSQQEKEKLEQIIKKSRPEKNTFCLQKDYPIPSKNGNLDYNRHFNNGEGKKNKKTNEDNSIFLTDGNAYYLTTEWSWKNDGTLNFNKLIENLGTFRYKKSDGSEDYIVKIICTQNSDGNQTEKNQNDISENIDISDKNINPNKKLDLPYQIICFGAPGTGKSSLLKQKEKDFDYVDRVTFYPGYSYQQFVGTYKPCTVEIEENGRNKKEIAYKFVPGPLLNSLVQALKNENKNHLLIIEELNRAEAAAVFGDFFQLLDRNDDGESEFCISISEDLKQYLTDNNILEKLKNKKLYFPGNFYIYATMNSADQGVFPLDTAFKRRWEFEFIGIDDREKELESDTQKFWNIIRKNINKELLETLYLNEDKLLSPFFMKSSDSDEKTFWKRFCNKVLLYLYEDAVRLRRKDFFNGNLSYSEICKILNPLLKGNGNLEICRNALNKIFVKKIEFNCEYPWTKNSPVITDINNPQENAD